MKPVVPILSLTESHQLERDLLGEGNRERQALHQAGHLLGKALEQDFQEIAVWPAVPTVLILGGKGHNTGDALLAVGDLLRKHSQMRVTLLWEGERNLRPLVAEIWRELQGSSLAERIAVKRLCFQNDSWKSLFAQPWTLVIDAVFGMGFRPPLPEVWRAVAQAIAKTDKILWRVSVDLPSGLSETKESQPLIIADRTYAMGIPKKPLFTKENLRVTGRIRFLDIGFFKETDLQRYIDHEQLLIAGVLRPLQLPRRVWEDKRHHGRVGIVAGSHRYPGAALLVTLAALQSGAGLVTSVVPESIVPSLAAQAPEAIWMGAPVTPTGAISLEMLREILMAGEHWESIVVGPGLTTDEETFCMVLEIVRSYRGALILDADVLRPELSSALLARSAKFGPVVLLPHAGEWQRLACCEAAQEEENHAREWAARHRVVLVRKGALTRVTDGHFDWISSRGGPVLARGGSGDMLAGMMGALFARYASQLSPLQIAGMAVYWQGITAEKMAAAQGENAVRNRQFLDYLALSLRESTD